MKKENFRPHLTDLSEKDGLQPLDKENTDYTPPRTEFADNYNMTDLSVNARAPEAPAAVEAAAEKSPAGRFEGVGRRIDAVFERGGNAITSARERTGRFFNTLGTRINSGVTRGVEGTRAFAGRRINDFNAWKTEKKEQMGKLAKNGAALAEKVRTGIGNKTKESLQAARDGVSEQFADLRSFGRDSIDAARFAMMLVKQKAYERATAKKIERAKEMAKFHAEQEAHHASEKEAWQAHAAEVMRRTEARSALRDRFAERARATGFVPEALAA
jgi:hypothetical protein